MTIFTRKSLKSAALPIIGMCTLLAVYAVSASQNEQTKTTLLNDEAEIQISYSADKNNKLYRVNDKQFYWRDLSTEQQNQLQTIENKLAQAERDLQINSDELAGFSQEMARHAKVLEEEVSKFETTTISYDKSEISYKDLSAISKKLAAANKINHELIREKEQEIQRLQSKFPVIDKTQIAVINQQAKALEHLLVSIASTM